MKRNKSNMWVVAVMIALSGTAAMAATQGDVTISGTVDAINEITVATQTGYDALSLSAGETDKLVAIVNEKNNNTAGYTVTLSSANAAVDADGVARLKGAGDASNTIVYTINYGGSAVTIGVDGTSVVTADGTNTGSAGVDKNVTVSTTAGWHNADTYSDTLTFTIASK